MKKAVFEKRTLVLSSLLLLSTLFVFVVFLQNNYLSAYASWDSRFSEENVYCEATLDDDFTNDTVSVVLSKDATYSYKEFTPYDFREIDASKVEDLTADTAGLVQKQIEAKKSGAMKFDGICIVRRI